MEHLEKTITRYRNALSLCPPGYSNRFICLNNLANAVLCRYGQSGRIEDIKEVIAYNREALTLCPIGHPDHPTALINLAGALRNYYERSGRMEDLEEAISCNRRALTLCPLGHPQHSRSLSNLGIVVVCCYEQSGRMEDLEEAITLYHKALYREALTLGHPNRYSVVLRRYEESDRMAGLQEVAKYNRQTLTLRPLGPPAGSALLINLANALCTRYKQSGRVEDLEDSIISLREALALCPLGNSYRSTALINLGNAVLCRYEQSGSIEDLEEVITYNLEALSLCPIGHPHRPSSLINLANTFRTCSEQSGRTDILEVAITCHREALTLCPIGHPYHSSSLNNLANAVFCRYEQLGRMEDLEEAITLNRKALTLRSLGHPHRLSSLHNLANVLLCRYRVLGNMKDLEEAITSYREALSFCPPGHLARSSFLNNLANALHTLYEQSGRIEDLEEAITYSSDALTLCPFGHPDRSGSLNNLANMVLCRYRESRWMKDLEEAITFNHEALALRPHGHPDRSVSLNNLANAVLCRYEQWGRMEDLEEVITSHREAVSLWPPGHPYRCSSLSNLANAVQFRYQQLRRIEDLEESFMLYEQAANVSASISKDRLAAAIRWADGAQRHRHNSVIRAYSVSLHLLDRCLLSYPNIESKQRFLATANIAGPLASDAASAAIDAKELDTAIELLEQGRAILWSKMDGYRHPLDQLRKVNEQLADRLATLSVELERLALSSESRPLDGENSVSLAHLDIQMTRHRILSEEWEELVLRIREIEGFNNFLQAVPFTTLQTAAAEGPIILINISDFRSDAIILRIDNRPLLVTLPNVQRKDLARLCKQLSILARDPDFFIDPSKLILPMLRDLWDDIVSPVCNCLTQLSVPEKSRVWWCPTSDLCALPLHAAGLYLPQKKNFPDIYTSSYTPTVSALIRARSNMTPQPIIPKLLFIGQSGDGLSKVQDEVDNIRRLGDFVDVVVGADASRAKVLDSLQQHSWVHFACHGRLGDNAQPFHASFELDAGSRLTLLDLIQARLPNAELAFLSACHSAAGDSNTPDETIHLAAALQFCGFRSVVGTMWAMEDEDGPTIAKEFYKHMFRNPGNEADFRDSAEALNLAIRAMRKNCVPLERWIMFVHIGA